MKIHVRRFGRWVELFPFVLLLQACASGAYVPGQLTDDRLPRQHTRFNVKVDNRESVFTLLEGEMTLTRPTYLELKSGQQVTVSEAARVEVRSLSDSELEEVTRWRSQFPPPCAGGGGECAPPGGISQCGQCTD